MYVKCCDHFRRIEGNGSVDGEVGKGRMEGKRDGKVGT